jgi:hypothetical protein
MKKKRRGKPAKRRAKSLAVVRGGKAARRKGKGFAIVRGIITLLAELGSIANFIFASYYFIKEFI